MPSKPPAASCGKSRRCCSPKHSALATLAKANHALAPFTKGVKPNFHDPLDNFCKLELWRLTDYRRIVFLDADTLAIRNIDKLFGYPEFCAAPNLYESLEDMHRLNSGVFVAEPNAATFDAMLEKLDAPGVFWRRTDSDLPRGATSRIGMACRTPSTRSSTSTSTCRSCGVGAASA